VIEIKKKSNLPVRIHQEEDMISSRRALAKEKGLDPDYVRAFPIAPASVKG
jgi:chorismate mutase